jgi:hypothetical protein
MQSDKRTSTQRPASDEPPKSIFEDNAKHSALQRRAAAIREMTQSSAPETVDHSGAGVVHEILETAAAQPGPYQPTEQEQIALAQYEKLVANAPLVPRFKFEYSRGEMCLEFDHPDRVVAKKLLMVALGIVNPESYASLISRLIDVTGADREINVTGAEQKQVAALNGMLAFIISERPENETEAKLFTQVAITEWMLSDNARESCQIQHKIDAACDTHPSRVKPLDPWEQANQKFLVEALARKEAVVRAYEKLAVIQIKHFNLLFHRDALKARDPSREPHTVARSGVGTNHTDQAVSGSKVLQLRSGVKS